MGKELALLFWAFFKIGTITFGGGYAMLPILQREIVEKYQWASMEDLANYYAIGQTTPGIIAINTATFIGYRRKGVFGAAVATVGLTLPGILIILLLANLLRNFSSYEWIQKAMKGIRVSVCVLILDALFKLRKTACVDAQTKSVFLIAFSVFVLFPELSPIWGIIGGAIVGSFLYRKEMPHDLS